MSFQTPPFGMRCRRWNGSENDDPRDFLRFTLGYEPVFRGYSISSDDSGLLLYTGAWVRGLPRERAKPLYVEFVDVEPTSWPVIVMGVAERSTSTIVLRRCEDGPGPATAILEDSSAEVRDGAEGLELVALLTSTCGLNTRRKGVTHGPVSEL